MFPLMKFIVNNQEKFERNYHNIHTGNKFSPCTWFVRKVSSHI